MPTKKTDDQLERMTADALLELLRDQDEAYAAAREEKRRVGAAYDAALVREREQAAAESDAATGKNGAARANTVTVKNG